MEDLIQILIDRYIPFDVKKASFDELVIELYIYIRDNRDETIISIKISFEKSKEPLYSWFDLRDDSRIELVNIKKLEIIEKLRQLELKDIYKIEE